jgi:hypothetical protein
MPRRSNPSDDLERLHQQAVDLLVNFKALLGSEDLREKVRALIPSFHAIRDLGASLMPEGRGEGARDRLITYLCKYPGLIIDGDELLVVSGIGEWARRVRELRVEHGWWINSGQAFQDIAADADSDPEAATEVQSFIDQYGINPADVKVDQYVLLSAVQDRDAAHRWKLQNDIKRKHTAVRDRVLAYLKANVGHPVTGEELRYLAGKKSEWARRVRELRTQFGWPVKTRSSGRPDLPVGVYVLEQDRQAPVHDRKIPDSVRGAVLKRDHYRCRNPNCGWDYSQANPADRRTMLELHHIHEHVRGGENTVENLITLCNVCHDEVHAGVLVLDPDWINRD